MFRFFGVCKPPPKSSGPSKSLLVLEGEWGNEYRETSTGCCGKVGARRLGLRVCGFEICSWSRIWLGHEGCSLNSLKRDYVEDLSGKAL